MPKEFKKFVIIFGCSTVLFSLLAVVVALFITEHWVAGIVVGIPFVSLLLAGVEIDAVKLMISMWSD